MTYIEEYYQFLLKNPDKACRKILVTYKKLVQDLYNPKQVSFYNEITEEEETHTYVFDLEKVFEQEIREEHSNAPLKGKRRRHEAVR